MTFDMPDPLKVQLEHNSNTTFDFTCGPQKPFPVAIEFVPHTGSDSIAGDIRKIEF